MKDIVRLVKVDEMYNISKSLLATGYWPRHEGGTGCISRKEPYIAIQMTL